MISALILVFWVIIAGIIGIFIGGSIERAKSRILRQHLYDVTIKTIAQIHGLCDNKAVIYVKEQIYEASNIASMQLDLWKQIDAPNRGAAHSKWKRDIIGQINELEAKKIDVFRKIMQAGHDLTVTIVEADGKLVKQKISQVIEHYDTANANKQPFNKSATDKSKTKTINKQPTLKLVKDNTND